MTIQVTKDTPFSAELLVEKPDWIEGTKHWVFHTSLGSITVLDRETGYGYSCRDIESGYRDNNGEFWLASGWCDVRNSDCKTVGEAINWIKRNANTCIGKENINAMS